MTGRILKHLCTLYPCPLRLFLCWSFPPGLTSTLHFICLVAISEQPLLFFRESSPLDVCSLPLSEGFLLFAPLSSRSLPPSAACPAHALLKHRNRSHWSQMHHQGWFSFGWLFLLDVFKLSYFFACAWLGLGGTFLGWRKKLPSADLQSSRTT